MSRFAVVDASVAVALLLDAGADGTWAADQLTGRSLLAPGLMPFETSNVIRRHESAGLISPESAALAHTDLLDLRIDLWPYQPIAARAWELRANLSAYDASYVAVAELTDTPLLTLDRRLGRAPGIRCPIRTPEG